MSMRDRRRALMAAAKGSGYAHGTWNDLFWHIDKGDYATEYTIGEMIPLDLGTEGIIDMQIAGFNLDPLSSSLDAGNAPVTFVAVQLLATSLNMGTTRNWETSAIRAYFRDTLLSEIPEIVKSRIVSVKKYTNVNNAGTLELNRMTDDKLFIPSKMEIFGDGETIGNHYVVVNTPAKRSRHKVGATSASSWYSRTAYSVSNYTYIGGAGGASTVSGASALGVLLCFCVGKEES